MAPPSADWYFVCQCEAKFFSERQTAQCPRCGKELESGGKIVPPWRLLTVADVAKRLNLSRSKVYELNIPHYKIGGAIRFTEEQVEEFLKGCEKRECGSVPAKRKPHHPRLKHLRIN